MTPVPATGARYTGVNGMPLPVVSWLRHRPPLEEPALHPVDQRASAKTETGRVLELRDDLMPLIEVGRRLLAVEIAPVLRDRALPAQAHAA